MPRVFSRTRANPADVVRPLFGGCLAAIVLNLSLLLLGPPIISLMLSGIHSECVRTSTPFWLLVAIMVLILLVAAWRVLRTRGRDYPQWAGFLIGTIVPFIPALLTLLHAATSGCHNPPSS